MKRKAALTALLFLWQATAGFAAPVSIGTTYSRRQSAYLELDWKRAYLEILNLNWFAIRLGAYWDEIEKKPDEYDFEKLDWQIEEAKKRNIPVVLTVGMKAPRWPEFFIPSWLAGRVDAAFGSDVSKNAFLRERTLKFVRAVVEHYRDEPDVRYWQVENEPMDREGPHFWWIGKDFLRQEVELVRGLDAAPRHSTGLRRMTAAPRPVILTAATYPNTFLFFLARFRLDANPIYECLGLCDILGINVYPVVGQKFWRFKIYFWSNPDERAEYFTKVLRLARRFGKDVWIMELQAEPWEPGNLVWLSPEEPPSTLPKDIKQSYDEFSALGFHVIFLWGSEFWYYRRVRHEDRHWWRAARQLLIKKTEDLKEKAKALEEKAKAKTQDWKEGLAGHHEALRQA